jgi:SAM-dependent methyltransferase
VVNIRASHRILEKTWKELETRVRIPAAAVSQFDAIASDYAKSNLQRPLMQEAVYPSFFKVIGLPLGRDALDLGCGEGLVARHLREEGAGRVVGIDSSAAMIELARKRGVRFGQSIDYRIGEVGKLGKITGSFEIVTGAFLLHYASSKEQLEAMCQDCYVNTAYGGFFAAINNNPEHPLSNEEKYNNLITCKNNPPLEGDVLEVNHAVPGTNVNFKNYHWSKDTYHKAIRIAGFNTVEWLPIKPTPYGVSAKGRKFWKEFLEAPFFVIIKCRKL